MPLLLRRCQMPRLHVTKTPDLLGHTRHLKRDCIQFIGVRLLRSARQYAVQIGQHVSVLNDQGTLGTALGSAAKISSAVPRRPLNLASHLKAVMVAGPNGRLTDSPFSLVGAHNGGAR